MLVFVSNWSTVVIVAVLVMDVVPVTVATICNVAVFCPAVLLNAPSVHKPVPLLNVPTEGVALTKVRPAGNTSVTWTPLAATGPLFVTVTVKVTF